MGDDASHVQNYLHRAWLGNTQLEFHSQLIVSPQVSPHLFPHIEYDLGKNPADDVNARLLTFPSCIV